MLQKEMNHWHWTCNLWEKVRYGLMVKVSEDIGLHTLLVIAMNAIMRVLFALLSVSKVAVNQHNDGNPSYSALCFSLLRGFLKNKMEEYRFHSGDLKC